MLEIILSGNELNVADFGTIRVKNDGWISIYDLIRVCCESTNRRYPSNTWNAIIARYPSILSDDSGHLKQHKFSGKGQRITPICDRETALKIIGLLPGSTGRKYRDIAAKLVLKYLQNPESLADIATDRMERLGDIEGLQKHQKRTETKIKRLKFTDDLKAHGVEKPYHYASITNGMTKDVLDKTATEIKKERNTKNARDAMTEFELDLIAASEALARVLLAKNRANGYTQCNEQSRKASRIVKNSLE